MIVIPASKVTRKQGTGTDVGSTAMHVAVPMVLNDFLEIWVENETDATNVTLQTLNFFAMVMP